MNAKQRSLRSAAIQWLRFIVVAALVAIAAPAHAQIAGAVGKPLPGPDLPTGTIVVKAIAGNPRNSLVGVDVTLLVNGEPQTAKTDAAGHARFDNLPVGATVVAKTE